MQHPHSRPQRFRPVLALAVVLSLAVTACSGGADTAGAPASAGQSEAPAPSGGATAAPSGTATAAPTTDSKYAVPGYAEGQIPPVPLFALPDLSLLTASTGVFTPDLTRKLTSRPGITVSPARCDQNGVLNGGSTIVGDDGTVVRSDDGSSVANNGDGSGTYRNGEVVITNNGDGSGTYDNSRTGEAIANNGDGSGTYRNGEVTITNNGDGSGTYRDSKTTIAVNGDGSGTYRDDVITVAINGDGSGTYNNSRTGESIANNGDGSGTYRDNEITIVNNGDGSGNYTNSRTGLYVRNDGRGEAYIKINDGELRTAEADPLPPVKPLGNFPTLDAIRPIESCGTVITLEDGLLFDFGSFQVRADSAETISELSALLKEAGAPTAHIYGHTDSVSDDAFNQTLSEQRAQAVVEALKANGVSTSLDATGFGETRPVAPNENSDGSDNPAGRQLNRRVEIFIPVF